MEDLPEGQELEGAATDEDFVKIKAAGFNATQKFNTTMLVNSMRYMHSLSAQLGKPMHEITTDDLIREMLTYAQQNTSPDA